MTDTDKERDEFREWYCATFNYRPQDMSDAYMLGTTAWKAWCEATRRAQRDAIPAKPEPVGWVDDGGLVFWRDGKPPKDGSELFAGGAAVTDEAKDAAPLDANLIDRIAQRAADRILHMYGHSKLALRGAIRAEIVAAIEAHTKGKV